MRLRVILSNVPTISRNIPSAVLFFAKLSSMRRTNSCSAVLVETPALNPYWNAKNLACKLESSLK